MAISDQLLSINNSKQEIKAAIEAKGVTVAAAPLADYAEKIAMISGGGPVINPWVRPADWLAMPTVTSTDTTVYILMAVNDAAYNFISFSATGSASGFTVDWGDGSSETAGNGTQINHNYSWASIDAGTLTSKGYRQALITITPVSGGTITSINLNLRHPLRTGSYQTTNTLDILITSPDLTSFIVGGTLGGTTTTVHTLLERVQVPYTASACTSTNTFTGCVALRKVELSTNITFANNTFDNCASIEEIPALTFSSTGLLQTFNACSSLKSIGAMTINNGAATVSAIGTFQGCVVLSSIPTITLSGAGKLATMQSMFTNCASITDASFLSTWDLSSVTAAASAFSGCTSLETVPTSLSLPSATTANSMFSGCNSLTTAPDLNLPVVTTINQIFNNCTSLLAAPTITTSTSLTNISSAFSGCSAMISASLFTTTNVTTVASMFQSCKSLFSIPAYNLSAVTTGNGQLISAIAGNGAFNLNASAVTGLRFTISYANSNLSSTELNNIYTNLGTATGQTITVTGNPGTTADDPTIATAKGWTVTG